jgi:hypothetical protein
MWRGAILSIVVSGCMVGPASSHAIDEPVDQTAQLSGHTVDYFTGAVIGDVGFETMGLAPERMAASAGDGAFAMDVPIASTFFVRTDATETHRPTVNPVIGSETTDLAVFSTADINRQHVTAGVEVVPDTTTVFVELTPLDGTMLDAFSRTNLSIVDPSSLQVIASNPFVIGPYGDVDPTLDSASGPSGRFVFLDVEPGEYALVVECQDCNPAFETEQPLISSAGVTLARVTLGTEPRPRPDAFETIYPLFARGADGGLGCANCHTAGGTTPAFDGDPSDVRDAILAASLVDVADPDRSLLLSKPLYETPANHPNATFLSTSAPDYQAIRAWIAAGAK